ncbi:MAG: carbamoyltransferase [Opitutales bacterium]|nr:carbamoyltransferase [Opitutales bacterium]
MRILGISAYYHDSAAVLLEEGRIVAAAQEERFTRIKHDPSLPINAIRYCLSLAHGAPDAVVFYEKPLLKFERILRTAFDVAPCGFRAFASAIPSWTKQKLWIPMQIENALANEGIDARGKIFFTSHHESHAASAFYASPYKSAAILTLDGVGEWSSSTMGRGKGAEMELFSELRFPHSLGLLYSAFTYYCGFRVNSGEYKLMGLAPYGEPVYKELILNELIDLKQDGSFRLNMKYFAYERGERMTSRAFHTLFGAPPRKPESTITQRDCDLARSIQAVTEEVVLKIANTLHARTGEENLCMAGGVALNCVANGRLLREGPFKRVWVQPAAGDAGGALGAALALHHLHYKAPRACEGADLMQGTMLGPEYSAGEIEKAVEKHGLEATEMPRRALRASVAAALDKGKVVGWFQGRAEYGPRALGCRSILGDARNSKMQSVLNLKIKKRESFRPFAPIVLAEYAQDYFALNGDSPYMLFTAQLRESRQIPREGKNLGMEEFLHQERSDIPAVTHVDYSARVQTVHANIHPELHALLSTFYGLTGCPVLINTSFNVRGEPPVLSPEDAINCFLSTDMDMLAIGPFLIDKNQNSSSSAVLSAKSGFALD